MKNNSDGVFVFLGGHIRSQLITALPKSGRPPLYLVTEMFGTKAMFIHHPSYIRIYRHKTLESYSDMVARLISNAVH